MLGVLLDGINHVAILTNDTERLHAFYEEVFDAVVLHDGPEPSGGPGSADSPVRLSMIQVGPYSELNVFQVAGNTEADRQTPMFGRGRIDHLALQAGSMEAFETIRQRLRARGAADDFVTDFGPILSAVLPGPRRPRVRGVRRQPGRSTRRRQSAGHPGGPLPGGVLMTWGP